MNKQLKDFFRSGMKNWLFVAGFWGLFGVVNATSFFSAFEFSLPFRLIMMIVSSFFFCFCLIPVVIKLILIRKMERDAALEQIGEDFDSAVSVFGGSLRFGRQWIFFRGKPKVLRYSEISELIIVDGRRNGNENTVVFYRDMNGKRRVFCQIALFEDRKVFYEITRIVLSRNPDIRIR